MHYALSNVITRNQKFPKIKHYSAFIFHWKSFNLFLNDATNICWANMLDVYTNICWAQICWMFVHLFAKKTWKAGHMNLIFGTKSNYILFLKKVENNFFIWAALLGANIFQIFSQLGSAKIFGLWFRGLCSTGPLNSFSTFPPPGWIATDS